MRKIINSEPQITLDYLDIEDIKINPKCRDEITQLLIGLQHLHVNLETRKSIFKILEKVPQKNINNGRPGMEIWQILVLALLRVNCNFDWDKLHNLANNHGEIRQMMGIKPWSDGAEKMFSLQTIRDNVALLKVEIINEINLVAINAGHKLEKKKDEEKLQGRCDSFVVESNIHYPTDTNLLFDAMRKVLTLMNNLCISLGINGTRKYSDNLKKLKRLLHKIQNIKRSTSKDPKKKAKRIVEIEEVYKEYLTLSRKLLNQTEKIISEINESNAGDELIFIQLEEIKKFILHADRQIDQIYRRCIKGEEIESEEKVYSIFEEYTEWISKGKAGVPVEFGLRVCIIEDQFGFILHHQIMEKETDPKITVQIIKEVLKKFPEFNGCSFDRGFWSQKNFEELLKLLEKVILPKKGNRNKEEKMREHSEEFIALRHQHSAVESAINALENHGLDVVRDRGIVNFKKYTALSVLGRNCQKLGVILQAKQLKKLKRQKRKQEALKKAA